MPGLAVTPDNSGIVGRTEVLIGTVRTEIGPAIPQTSGRPIVFEMTVKPSGGSSGVNGMTDGGGQPGLGDIPTSQIQVFADPPEDPDNAACEKAQEKVKAASKKATQAKKNAAKAATRLKKAKKSKKAMARKQANRARKNAKKANEALRRSRGAAKDACG